MFYVLGTNPTDISIENILVPTEGCVLTGGLTDKDRSGTLIDWNLCFNARGESSNRAFKSGTPAFMAPVLLEDRPIPRRTLAHDMESFFAVIIWIATFDYFSEAAFQAKPLAMLNKKKAPMDIVNAKECWFNKPGAFESGQLITLSPSIVKRKGFASAWLSYAKSYTRYSRRMRRMILTWMTILTKVTEDADPMKEIDDYLGETKGCDEMEQIGRWRAAEGTDGRGA